MRRYWLSSRVRSWSLRWPFSSSWRRSGSHFWQTRPLVGARWRSRGPTRGQLADNRCSPTCALQHDHGRPRGALRRGDRYRPLGGRKHRRGRSELPERRPDVLAGVVRGTSLLVRRTLDGTTLAQGGEQAYVTAMA